jgi:hypothetical protein
MGYTLQYRVTGTSDWTDASNDLAANADSYEVTNLNPETSYDFRINANSPEADSDWSNIATLTTAATPLPVPEWSWDNSAYADGPSSITLNWSVNGAYDNLVIERSTDGVNWTVAATLPAGTTDYTDTGLSPSSTYQYRLYTTLNGQNSSYSPVVSATTNEAPPLPTAPAFIIAAADSDTDVGIFWLGAGGASNYLLERSLNGSPWTVIANLTSATNYFTDTNLAPSTWYAYQVISVNNGGSSPPSVTAYVQTYTEMNSWLLVNFGTALATAQTDPLAVDGDGVPNLTKFAFNLTVGQPATTETVGTGTSGLPAIWFDANTHRLCVEFVQRTSALNPGITYTVEFSNDLVTWTPGGTLIQTQAIDSVWERVRYQDDLTLPNATAPLRFARVLITETN